jgi:5,10-methylenetetrahydromethanopterin reductase
VATRSGQPGGERRTPAPRLGINRWDVADPVAFAEQAGRAEAMGVGSVLLGTNPLRVIDPYVCLAFAAHATRSALLAPFVENPVLRGPAIAANAMATIDGLAPTRTRLVYGAGDTAVRFLGRRPASVAELADATAQARQWLSGAEIDTGAGQAVRMRNARPVQIWIAASGPRTLASAGRVADGVYLRVGTSERAIRGARQTVERAAVEAGRGVSEVGISIVVHVIAERDIQQARAIRRAVAAGFFQSSPRLFDAAGARWDGPPLASVAAAVWPDFHHHEDLVAAGDAVPFLDDETTEAFSVAGSEADIAMQLRRILAWAGPVDTLVVNPMPYPRPALDFVRWFTDRIWPHVV